MLDDFPHYRHFVKTGTICRQKVNALGSVGESQAEEEIPRDDWKLGFFPHHSQLSNELECCFESQSILMIITGVIFFVYMYNTLHCSGDKDITLSSRQLDTCIYAFFSSLISKQNLDLS